jgi:hypothetical protein
MEPFDARAPLPRRSTRSAVLRSPLDADPASRR